MKRLQFIKFSLLILGTILVFTAPSWLPEYYIQLSSRSLILSLTAMTFILLAGYGGMTSLAQMSFFAISGYLIGICVMTKGWSFSLAIPIAIIGAILLSAVFGLVAIRARGTYFLMITLALSQVSYGIAMQWARVTRGSEGFSGIIRPSIFNWSLIQPIPLYYVTIITVFICYVLMRMIVNSIFGLVIQGIRDNPERIAALGYNVQLHRYIILIISGMFAGIAGILGVFYYGSVSPSTTALSQTILVVMAAISGGVSRLEGGILGAFITILIWSIASQHTQHYMTVIGFIFALIIIFLPKGILGSILEFNISKIINIKFLHNNWGKK